MNKRRIWELDALRGFGILWVILLHFLFDLQLFCGINLLERPLLQVVMQWGGEFFVLLSGLCATLGKQPFRRGVQIFAWAMAITFVTWVMAKLGFMGEDMVIRFGVLHLLGLCMILWTVAGKLPTWLLALLGLALVVLGKWFETVTVHTGWLFPLGLTTARFTSGDYFPLMPHLGWFFLGAVIGRTLYKKKQSLFPQGKPGPLCWCGRHSLLLYLLHQPVIYGIFLIFA